MRKNILNKLYYGGLLILLLGFFQSCSGDEPNSSEDKPIDVESFIPLELQLKDAPQGMAIYGDTIACLQDQAYCRLYSVKTGRPIARTFRLGCANGSNHANTADFGVEKADPKDATPVLYVSQCNATNISIGSYVCFVERLHDDYSTLVQTIALDDADLYYGNPVCWVVDRENKHLVAYGNTIYSYHPHNTVRVMVFPLPKLADGEKIHLKAKDALENYKISDYSDAYDSQRALSQGATIHDGCLWLPTGNQTQSPNVLYVWDMNVRRMRAVFDLRDDIANEMEDIDFHDGKAYIYTNNTGIYIKSFTLPDIKPDLPIDDKNTTDNDNFNPLSKRKPIKTKQL